MRLVHLAFLAALIAPALVFAEEPPDPASALRELAQHAGVSGSLRGGYWSSSRDLDDREHFAGSALWLKAAPKLLPNASLLVDGWIRNQDLFHEEATVGELREAYVDLSLGPVDLRLGKQIIAWGRADRINPTDNLTPRDFTLLVPDDDDQRLGAPALKASYHLGDITLTAVGIPYFEPHTTPLKKPAPPFTARKRLPDNPVGQWGIKVEQTGKALDWSVSYFDGFDLSPDLGIDRATSSSVELLLRHHRVRVIGADAATTIGRYGLRGEAAYTFTEDLEGDDPKVKNPFFFMVVGGDRTFLEYLNVNLQYILRAVVNYRSPVGIPNAVERSVAMKQAVASNQLDRVQHGASLRVSNKWLNETLEGELAGILSFTRGDYAIRPKLTYAFTDRWKGVVGADLFRGPRRSYFGDINDNTAAYAELRLSF